jgi:hypothetical protein
MDIHTYSLPHHLCTHMHSLDWSKHILQIVLDSQRSEVSETQDDKGKDTSATTGAERSQDPFSAMVHAIADQYCWL